MDQPLPTGSETVLLVEDQDDVRRTAARILERQGYHVLQAGEPEQAEKMARLSNIHLVVMDVVLPGMNGLQLASQIRSHRPGVRVLFTSGFTSEEVLERDQERRPDVDFLQKPYSPRGLAQAIRNLLDRETGERPTPEPLPGGDEAILIVDADDRARRETAHILEGLGYRVLEAHFPDRALTIGRNSRIDLVLTAAVFPEARGMDLAMAMAEDKPDLRFLFVSERPREELPGREDWSGRLFFLQKPFNSRGLSRAVRETLDAGKAGGNVR